MSLWSHFRNMDSSLRNPWGDAFRAGFQWQPQLSKKRDFLPIMFPRDFV